MLNRRSIRQNLTQALRPKARQLIDGCVTGTGVGCGDGQEDLTASIYAGSAMGLLYFDLGDRAAVCEQIVCPVLHSVYSLLECCRITRRLQREKKVTGKPDVSGGGLRERASEGGEQNGDQQSNS